MKLNRGLYRVNYIVVYFILALVISVIIFRNNSSIHHSKDIDLVNTIITIFIIFHNSSSNSSNNIIATAAYYYSAAISASRCSSLILYMHQSQQKRPRLAVSQRSRASCCFFTARSRASFSSFSRAISALRSCCVGFDIFLKYISALFFYHITVGPWIPRRAS